MTKQLTMTNFQLSSLALHQLKCVTLILTMTLPTSTVMPQPKDGVGYSPLFAVEAVGKSTFSIGASMY